MKRILTLLFSFFAFSLYADDSRFIGVQVGPGMLPPGQHLRTFLSDGCSMSPDGFVGSKILIVDCCILHDIRYWLGGTEEQKIAADLELKACVSEKTNSAIGWIYYQSVSTFNASPISYARFRWGYGWNIMRPFSPITPREMAEAEFFHGKGLSDLFERYRKKEIKVETVATSLQGKPDPWTLGEIAIGKYFQSHLAEDQVIIDFLERKVSQRQTKYTIYTDRCPQGYYFTVDRKNLKTEVSVQTTCPLKSSK